MSTTAWWVAGTVAVGGGLAYALRGRSWTERIVAVGAVTAVGAFAAWQTAHDRLEGPPTERELEATEAALDWPGPPPPDVPDLPPPGEKVKAYPQHSGPGADPSEWQAMATTEGMRVRAPSRSWATPQTAFSLYRAADRFAQAAAELYLDDAKLVLWDVSREGGGPLTPHRSHQDGRNADITFEGGKGLSPLALPLLLKVLLADDNVQSIFLDWGKQGQAWHAAEVNPEAFGGIQAELQYPLAPHTGRTRVRHWPGHADHLHVRFLA
jgi:hypothetical protein